MGKVLRCLVLLATLGLWAGPSGAFCVSEVAYEYVMRGSDSPSEQSLPCCIAAGPVGAPGHEDRPIGGRVPVRTTVAPAALDPCRSIAGPAASPLRWRAYCERSSRLLR